MLKHMAKRLLHDLSALGQVRIRIRRFAVRRMLFVVQMLRAAGAGVPVPVFARDPYVLVVCVRVRQAVGQLDEACITEYEDIAGGEVCRIAAVAQRVELDGEGLCVGQVDIDVGTEGFAADVLAEHLHTIDAEDDRDVVVAEACLSQRGPRVHLNWS